MMLDDAKLSNFLPKNQFAQLVYEDLVQNPVQTLLKLHEKLEMPTDLYSIRAILRHLDKVPKILVNSTSNSYMSLYRGPQHESDAWKHAMKEKDLQEILTKCSGTLKKFGYE